MSTHPHTIPRRPYGMQGDELSIVGLGGIVIMDMDQAEANRYVARAVQRGVNYFDVAPAYGGGAAETRLGPALAPYRPDCFLACKTGRRDAEGAEAEIQQSFERLGTDYFDLYQLHGLSKVEQDVEAAFAPGGVMQLIDRYKQAGRIRHVGFSAHSTEAAVAAMQRYDFDSILVPLNFVAWMNGGFGPQIVDAARQRGMSILALKALARHKWPENDPLRDRYAKCWYRPITDFDEAQLALRFTLSLPVCAAIPPGEAECLDMAMDLAERFEPITEDQTARLRELARGIEAEPVFAR
jgi:aryl-alcohol dehydrogenase-like predicted oxidoreductase